MNSMDAILLTIPNGSIINANPAAEQMFGWSVDEICAGGRELIVDSSDPRLGPAIEERRKHGRLHAELTFKRKKGGRFVGEVSSAIFQTHEGPRSSMIVRDITHRLALEATLRDLEKVKLASDLAAVVAHEVNNPLAFIVPNLSLIRANLNGTELPTGQDLVDLRTVLDEVVGGVNRICALMRGFGQLSGLSGPSEVEAVDVPACVGGVIQTWTREHPDLRILVTQACQAPFTVRASPGDLEEALVCLLDYLGTEANSTVLVAFGKGVELPLLTLTAMARFFAPGERESLFNPRVEVGERKSMRLNLKLPIALALLARNGCTLSALGDATHPVQFDLQFTRPTAVSN